MPLKIKEAIIVPEKSFDKYWVASITISAPMPGHEVSARAYLLPHNDLGEVYPEGGVELAIEDISAKAAMGGNFAKAMYFILEAINEEKEAQDNSVNEEIK